MQFTTTALAAFAFFLNASATPIASSVAENLEARVSLSSSISPLIRSGFLTLTNQQITTVTIGTGFSDNGPANLVVTLTEPGLAFGTLTTPINGVTLSAQSVQDAGFFQARCIFGDITDFANNRCDSTISTLFLEVSSFDEDPLIFPVPQSCVTCAFT